MSTISTPRTALTREAAAQLSQSRGEPDWLLDIRLRAFEAFERLPIPDQRTEGWRRTSLRGLDLSAFDPLGEWYAGVVAPEGATVMDLREALQDAVLARQVEKHFAKLVAPDVDKFTALHYAFFNAGVVVYVQRGAAVEAPVWVTYELEDPARAALPHTLVIAEDESNLNLVEEYSGNAGFASGVVEQSIGSNAHVRYVQLQCFGSNVWNFSTQRAQLARDASLRTLNIALGSRMARNAVQVVLDRRGSQADLLGVVDIAGRQHVDFETLQVHTGDDTRSDLVIHDALRDRASANFTGLIRINPSAHRTESSQEQKNILLSDSCKADSDPKLEILNNDVIRCTHGAAVGPVDEEMVFYLQSRGLDRAAAESLIVEGFFQSTLARLGLEPVQQAVWSAIRDKWANG